METTRTTERERPWKTAAADPEGPLGPACGGGDLVKTLVGREPGPSAALWYCAGVWDARLRHQARRSCGWVGTLP
jgi:hypothetical protein